MPDDVRWTRLVVDNGSTDESLAVLPARFPEARFLPTGANLRWAGGNNAGLALATKEGADGALLLNNDTLVEPDGLARLLAAVDGAPRGRRVRPDHPVVRRRARVVCGRRRVAGARLGRAPRARPRVARRRPRRAPEAVPCGYVTGAALYATRACLERVGLLDEGYYLYGEDADYCLRARAAGFACLWAPAAVVRHKVSGSSGPASPFKAYHRTRAGLRLARTHARGVGRSRGASRSRRCCSRRRRRGRCAAAAHARLARRGRRGSTTRAVSRPATRGSRPRREAA